MMHSAKSLQSCDLFKNRSFAVSFLVSGLTPSKKTIKVIPFSKNLSKYVLNIGNKTLKHVPALQKCLELTNLYKTPNPSTTNSFPGSCVISGTCVPNELLLITEVKPRTPIFFSTQKPYKGGNIWDKQPPKVRTHHKLLSSKMALWNN